MSTARLTMAIYDLACGGGGALTIERVLARSRGVVRAYVNPATEMAYVEYDQELTDPNRLIAAIESVGFRAGELSMR